jgi:hypothetical protein
VPAIHTCPVPAVAGSAVCDSPLVTPVIVDQDTQVKEIRSSISQLLIYILPFVTVGTDARYNVVSAVSALFDKVVTKPLWKVCVIG